jgi:hypothetical protein
MEIEQEKPNKAKKIAKDVLEVLGDAIGTAAAPSTLWLLVLWNCNGGAGFNGFVSNPNWNVQAT